MGIIDKAREMEKAEKARPSTDSVIGVVIGLVIGTSLRLLWQWRITLAWVLAFVLLANLWDWWGVVLVVLAAVATFHPRPVPAVQPFVADMTRNRAARRLAAARVAGNDWLREVRLVPATDERDYDCGLFDEGDSKSVVLGTPIMGVPSPTVAQAARDFADRLNAHSVKIEELGGGALKINFRMTDPLAQGITIHEPAALDVEKMAVTCGVDDEGKPFSLSFREVAGTVVSGIPGSGKTAGVSTFMLPLALSEHVEFSIIDGKGGTDWSAYKSVAENFISVGGEIEDFEKVHALVMNVRDSMNARLSSQKESLGQSNFWNADAATRAAAGLPFRFLVIDEAQEIFNFMTSDRDGKQKVADVTAALTSIVKRGRSAGVHVLFISQKMTADAIPTSIRDNCGNRLSFRLLSPEAERAVLGMEPDDDLNAPRPTSIPPANKGQAVFVRDTGDRAMVRFYYMPETEIEKVLEVKE